MHASCCNHPKWYVNRTRLCVLVDLWYWYWNFFRSCDFGHTNSHRMHCTCICCIFPSQFQYISCIVLIYLPNIGRWFVFFPYLFLYLLLFVVSYHWMIRGFFFYQFSFASRANLMFQHAFMKLSGYHSNTNWHSHFEVRLKFMCISQFGWNLIRNFLPFVHGKFFVQNRRVFHW